MWWLMLMMGTKSVKESAVLTFVAKLQYAVTTYDWYYELN